MLAADGEAAAPVTAEAVNDFMRVDAITQSFLWQYSESPIAGCDLSVLSVLLPVGAAGAREDEES